MRIFASARTAGLAAGLWLLAAAGGVVLSAAQGGEPTVLPAALSSLSPVGARRGNAATFTLGGVNIQQATAAVFDDPAITGTVAPGSDANQAKVTATLASATRLGIHRLFLRTPLGTTGAVTFAVGDWPEVAEREPNDLQAAGAAPLVSLPATFTGAVDRPGDVDCFRFTARAGQELVFEVVAQPVRSRLNSVLTLVDEQGRVLAENNDALGRIDSALGYRFESPGTYAIRLHDFENAGGGDVYYRLNAGEFRYVTGAFPLGLRAGTAGEIALTGFNLGETEARAAAPQTGGPGETFTLPEPPGSYAVTPVRLAVGREPERLEAETIDTPVRAERIPVPVTINGKVHRQGGTGADVDYFRFAARRGRTLILEVMARRLGSPLDSALEVLDTNGRPVERATLRPVAETALTLSDRDSGAGSFRLVSWTDLRINDFVYCRGELLQVTSLPKGPDDDVRFKSFRGQRLGLLDTTPTAHAVNTAVYKVQVHPPGRTFPPNGMPVFRVYTRNDDGGPLYGKDSRLRFEPPADGEYLLRIADVRGAQGPEFAYRLTIRPEEPDFQLTLGTEHPNVPAGAGVPVEVNAERRDEFAGAIEVELQGVPEGFHATPGVIEPGEFSCTVMLYADANVDTRTAPLRVVGRARLGDRELVRTVEAPPGGRTLAIIPRDLEVATRERRLTIRPGEQVTVTARIDRRNGFGGRVPIDVRNLPFGVRVLNVGLNGVLIPEQDTERTFVVYCEPWVKPQTRPFYCVGRVETSSPTPAEVGAPPLLLEVAGGPAPGARPAVDGR